MIRLATPSPTDLRTVVAARSVAAIVLTLCAAPALGAIELNPTDNTNVVGVDDFQFMGMLFDVEFSQPGVSYNDVFGTETPLFLGDPTTALGFAQALVDELNTLDPLPTSLGAATPVRGETGLFIVTAATPTSLAGPNVVATSSGSFLLNLSVGDINGTALSRPQPRNEQFAIITKVGSVVPEAASSLVWIGLAGVAAVKTRRRN